MRSNLFRLACLIHQLGCPGPKSGELRRGRVKASLRSGGGDSRRRPLTLVRARTVREVFDVFERHQYSLDLLSASRGAWHCW